VRKDLQLAAVTVVSLALFAAVAGCGSGGGTEEPPPPPTLLITTTTMPDGVVGTAYSQTVQATGGTGARTFSISAGTLPAGLNMDASTGTISGAPTGPAGTASFTVQVVDAGSPQQTDTQALTIDINDPLVITTAALPDATIGVAYNQAVAATGGTAPYTFTISSGAAPAGLAINGAGTISGTPTAAATSQTFTVRVADSSNPQQVDTQVLTILVDVEIVTLNLPDGVIGTPYSQTVMARGGRAPYSFSLTAGVLPGGLGPIGAATGTIAGTPTTAETQAFTVQVTDADAQTDTQALSITIAAPLNITTAALSTATIGQAYNETVMATGGTPPYTFTVTAGGLPAGLSLAANGDITGPATGGATNQTFTVTVTDSGSQTDATDLFIRVTLEIFPTTLPDATGGAVYNQTLQARGGQPPYGNWQRVAGNMPAGLPDPVAGTGVINGTPDPVCMATVSNFDVQVDDSEPVSDIKTISLTVNPGAALDIVTTSLTSGVVGTPYSQFVQATGGVPPYSFAVTTGNLPSQLAITAGTGEISGTPDTAETQNFSVTVTDACNNTDVQALSITINATSLGRNDSVATATPLGNGTFSASISPSGDPNSVLAPDQDFYEITTTQAATVTVNINAQVNGSPLDSVIEIVDVNGVRLNLCVSPGFTSACVHDDEVTGVQLDSFLEIQVPAATTFYVHVVDFRGDGRPDLLYDIVISGVQ
jgi:hypothetical protein